MRRLLVTGRHGFVGTALVRRVAERHADQWEVLDVPPALDSRDLASVCALVAAARQDAVIHLAAQSAVPDALRDPETTLNVNLLGTPHLLQALDACDFRGQLL